MVERVKLFLAGDHISRLLFIEERVRAHSDFNVRAYVGMYWSWVYKQNKESIDD